MASRRNPRSSATGSLSCDIESRWSIGVRARPFLQSLVGVKYHLDRDRDSVYRRYGYEPE